MQNGTNITNGDVSYSNKVNDTLNSVFSYEHLYNSYLKCIKGVKWKITTQQFMINACFNIAHIYKDIINNDYKMNSMHFFTVCERGKTRNISALSLKDRIVHKCMCDYYLTPLLSRKLIYDSGATIRNKGILFTKNRVLAHLHKYFQKHGNSGYALKIDFHNYFESIDHNILFQKLKKEVDPNIYNFLISLIPQNIKGLGLGSQISQICAMYYLNEIDHYCKEKLKLKYYARYMDDIYVISNNYNELKCTLKIIKNMAHKLKLEINENKTKIIPLNRGFIFCKVKYVLTDSGKIIKLITTKTFKSMNRKIKYGLDVKTIYPSWKSYISWFNSYKRFNFFINRYIIK